MDGFFDNVNEHVKDNAGLYGAMGGIAALKGQEAQRAALKEQAETLRNIEEELRKAETRAEEEAALKRWLVSIEDICENYEESLKDENNHWSIAAAHSFDSTYCQDFVGTPSEQLSAIDDIKYAKKLEKIAESFDKALSPCCHLYAKLKNKGVWSTFQKETLYRLEDEIQSSLFDFFTESRKDEVAIERVRALLEQESYNLLEELASEKGIEVRPLISRSNLAEGIIAEWFTEWERGPCSYLFENKLVPKTVSVSSKSPVLLADSSFKNSLKVLLNHGGSMSNIVTQTVKLKEVMYLKTIFCTRILRRAIMRTSKSFCTGGAEIMERLCQVCKV